jgi:hypothetical protein
MAFLSTPLWEPQTSKYCPTKHNLFLYNFILYQRLFVYCFLLWKKYESYPTSICKDDIFSPGVANHWWITTTQPVRPNARLLFHTRTSQNARISFLSSAVASQQIPNDCARFTFQVQRTLKSISLSSVSTYTTTLLLLNRSPQILILENITNNSRTTSVYI